ncbi:hypothetical protein EB796_017930 [Bugula neritina]|uniref:Uncharacterized protein n=1 Tax=Bugula neritina TaxID=10212 RepID=A0A7J7JDP1_BUGNE|nr:hypothetical protein EB796_017930 [Bugula neritina]
MAVTATMNRNLSQALRDSQTTIESLNRSQQATYKTMCKKKKQKEAYQKYQLSLREGLLVSTPGTSLLGHQIKRKVIHGQQLTPIEQSDSHNHNVKATSSEDKDGSETKSHQPSSPSDNKVAESKHSDSLRKSNNDSSTDIVTTNVIGGDRLSADVTSSELEHSMSGVLINSLSAKKAFFTASLRPALPSIHESSGSHMVKHEDTSNHINLHAASLKADSSMSQLRHTADSSDAATSAQRAVSLRAKIAELERQHIEEFLRKQNLETKLKPYQMKLGEEPENCETTTVEKTTPNTTCQTENKVPRSIAAERRRLAKLRSFHRKAVLNSEDNFQYVKMSDGSFLQGPKAYKRKRFLPPSNRAQQERTKILKSEAAKAVVHEEKIGQFFTNLNLPISKPADSTKKVLKKLESKAKIELADVKPILREKSVVPLDKIAETITYIRRYVRPVDRPRHVPLNTSWSQHH